MYILRNYGKAYAISFTRPEVIDNAISRLAATLGITRASITPIIRNDKIILRHTYGQLVLLLQEVVNESMDIISG